MQEIIEQILAGDFVYENSSLDFSCSKLELALPAGTTYEGTFQIHTAPGTLTNGYIYTTDLRMECLTPRFYGTDEEISFCFHGEHVKEGQVIKGAFNIVSNHGEFYLPFVVSIEHRLLESSIGTIKNMFHFTNLAKSNWKEAVKLFYSPEFKLLFAGNDEKVYEAYRGLSAVRGNEQNVEEFLIHMNKKQRVEFLFDESELSLEISNGEKMSPPMELGVNITRNGWGYTSLCVECDGEFLSCEKELITDDDFLGTRYRLSVYVDPTRLREGKNLGQVVLYNSYEYLTVPVTVKVEDNPRKVQSDVARKRLAVQVMDYYQAFRLKQISAATWRKETARLVERLVALDERDITARLFQAQLLISEERYNEAEWLLEHGIQLMEQKHPENETLRAYYLYLTTLIHSDTGYVRRVAEEVERIYKRDTSQWRVAWLLLYLSEEYNKSATGKWMFLEKQFYYGCISPVLYIEALALLKNNPTLLRRLDIYELQLIYYGARHQALTPDVIEQFVYLAERAREFSMVLLRTLELLYNNNPDERILSQICTLLIKGAKASPEYFEWYRLGVEAQLRITNLYEYYMMSMEPDYGEEIPKIVLMYFSYQNNLDYEHTAFLYAYVLQRKNEIPELYEKYLPWMERFVVEQIKKYHINRNLAQLYQAFLQQDMVDKDTAAGLSKLLFANQIQVSDGRIRKVILYRPGFLAEEEYPVVDHATWVPLYGNEYTILFEDAFGNRFMNDVEYTLEKTMVPGRMTRWLLPYDCRNPQFDLHICNLEQGEPIGENMNRMKSVSENPNVSMDIRREILLKRLKYYYEQDDYPALDILLEELPYEDFTQEERAEAIRYMVLREQYESAFDKLKQFGPYAVEVRTLVRLVTEMLQRNGLSEDPVLIQASEFVFREGKYGASVLQYLSKYFRGTVKEMRDIWKAARSFDADCYELSERLLVQMLYSKAYVGEKMDVFRYYVSQGAKQEVERAFLEQSCFDYFAREKLADVYLFQQIRYAHGRGEEISLVCKLAYLKYFSENMEEMDEELGMLAKEFLAEVMQQGIHLEFFRKYQCFREIVKELDDRTIIEYCAKPGSVAMIHYVTMHDNGNADEYLCEPMQEVLGGVCFKEFVLFFGECLQYYITEQMGDEESLMESGSLQKSDIVGSGDGNLYEYVNDIVISKTLEDYDTLERLLEEYYRKEYYNRQLFDLM